MLPISKLNKFATTIAPRESGTPCLMWPLRFGHVSPFRGAAVPDPAWAAAGDAGALLACPVHWIDSHSSYTPL